MASPHVHDLESLHLLSEYSEGIRTTVTRSRFWRWVGVLALGLSAILCAATLSIRSGTSPSQDHPEDLLRGDVLIQESVQHQPAKKTHVEPIVEEKLSEPVNLVTPAPLPTVMPAAAPLAPVTTAPAPVATVAPVTTAPAPVAPVTQAPVKLPKPKQLKMPNLTVMPNVTLLPKATPVPIKTVTPVLPLQGSQSPSNSTIWEDPFSMFCFLVVVPSEMELIRWQFKNGAGIFSCTSWRVYSGVKEPMLIGTYPDGTTAKTTSIPGPEAFFGKAYFWGCDHSTKYLMNANVLQRAWDNAQAEGVAGLHSYIIKVDPDSALSAIRLRKIFKTKQFHKQDNGKTAGRYFKNCRVMSSMQGSIEILSRHAFYIYNGKKAECQRSMDWWHMGEDIFTFKCLEQLGVEASDIGEGVRDTYCARSKSCVEHHGLPNCSLPDVALFHPLKSRDQFEKCWEEIQRVEQRAM